MRHEYHDSISDGQLIMTIKEPNLTRYSFRQGTPQYNTLIWNRGESQYLIVDEMRVEMPRNTFFCLNLSHSFRLERAEETVVWQFNKAFYCIITHDAEVSCYGLLFYGWGDSTPILLDEKETRNFQSLVDVFCDEFDNKDNIQGEMLRVLLKRLIIKLTRLVKLQAPKGILTGSELDTVRRFNILVENNFKNLHQVQDYARLMFKSPKTLSNLFSKYSEKSPLQIISDRIFLESKRLILYSEKSNGEIGATLGFEEAAHFSRFFKKMAGQTPTDFKKNAILKG